MGNVYSPGTCRPLCSTSKILRPASNVNGQGPTRGAGGYYGYTLNALVRVAGPNDVHRDEPRLIERIIVTPAGRNLIWASRELIARAQPSDQERILLGDRWYSNLKEDNWYKYLRANGWNQAVDMHEDDQTWTDVRGMRITAGWPHCPATPDALQRIPKPIGPREEFQFTPQICAVTSESG